MRTQALSDRIEFCQKTCQLSLKCGKPDFRVRTWPWPSFHSIFVTNSKSFSPKPFDEKVKILKVWNATKLCPKVLVKLQLSSLWPMRSNSCWQIPGQSVASNCTGRHSRMSHVCSKILRRRREVETDAMRGLLLSRSSKKSNLFLLFSSCHENSLYSED